MNNMDYFKDVEAIKQLRRRYCFLVDEKKWEEAIEMFAEDSSMDFGALGVFPNREDLLSYWNGLTESLIFSAHMMHNPIIEVKGDEATGDWYLTCHATPAPEQAIWLLAVVHDEYRRIEGLWKFSSIKYDFKYMTPYEQGWGKMPFPPPQDA